MLKLSSTKLVVAIGGLALWSTTGVASAQPDLSPFINTTCSYSQVVAALNAEAPNLAKLLSQYPMAQSSLQNFLAAPPDQRQQMAQQAANTPFAEQNGALFVQIANTCNNY